MIYLFASDIHGSAYAMHTLLDIYTQSKATKLILLGDLLYHGPRNDLPHEYNPKETYRLQNLVKDSLICVKGNCDTEVDQMVLEFPMLSDSAVMYLEQLGGSMIYLHHGHKELPPLQKGTIVVSGHTHIPVAEERDGLVFINPGSVAIPKGGYPPTYCLLEERTFTIKDFDGNVVKSLTI
ncbi:MAG: phosphodiesterase [Sphaerochaeta sp.]|uniref:phosphodiesterase n=1 Tax=Sphaerochaeta sp. TaxID=1972642 RepID=UPI003D0CF076